MSSSRAGLRSRPGVVREGRPLPKNTATKAARSARPTAAQRRREATPISVPPSPSTPTRRVTAGSRAPFIVLVLVLAAGGLIGLVLLNTAVNENAFRLHDLDTEQSRLDKEEQRLQQALQDQESPKKLADRAKDLGLVPAGDPGFVVLPEGKVVGTPVPAKAPPSPTPSAASPRTSSSPSSGAGTDATAGDATSEDATGGDDADASGADGDGGTTPTPSAGR
ncbi:hypothetical protein [Cryptosporangium arvum]|uniref:hypothetical protein n=1 Tax=Cryptosporangium arvum TaxID=80871 RepID=UPI0012ECE729|nr:hypothetical protein [Cryptosporangium arvum]